MENSTKALIIAAGVLFAIMILSLLVLSYNRLTNAQQTKQSSMSEEQLSAFNKEYEAYNRDDVTGFELVGLINKIIDFNAHNAEDETLGFKNSDRAYEKMYIEFTLKNTGKLFTDATYNSESSKTNEALEKIMSDMRELENTYTSTLLNAYISLGSEYNPKDPDQMNELLKRNSKNKITKFPSVDEVQKYSEYVDFKRAKFKCTGTEYNNKTGRIVKLYFEQT